MKHRANEAWMALGLLVAVSGCNIALSGCTSIVGLECADGLMLCGDRCLATCALDGGGDAGAGFDAGDADTPVDAALDAADGDGSVVDAGDVDGGDADGSVVDAGDVDGGDADGSVVDAGDVDGGDADGGGLDGGGLDAGGEQDASFPSGCDLGELLCGGVCLDGRSDPANCGGCGITCAPAEVCSGGTCAATCPPPSRVCAGRCIDVTSDADNCGACGVVCASGICIEGDCSEPLAEHLVVIGHDYEVSRRGMNRIAGNAVFLARGSPTRVLVWEGESSAATRVGTDAAIEQVAAALGRTWTRAAPGDSDAVTLLLAEHDAFVIYAQSGSADASLRMLGEAWARALQSFLERGGVIVLFETMSTTNAGTWQILDAAGLFACTGRTETTGSIITVTAPADSVALRVPLAYSGERTTVRFATTEGVEVTSDGTGPVVLHRTVVP